MRHETCIEVAYGDGDTFLFSYMTNISEMGIFVRSEAPLPVGTLLTLRIGTGADPEVLELSGEVVWVNPLRTDGAGLNPGMGIRFSELTAALREKVVDIIRTVAYLNDGDGN